MTRFRWGHDANKRSEDAALTRFNDCCRFLTAVRHEAPEVIGSLENCVVPANYPAVLAGAKAISGFDPATHRVTTSGTVDRLLANLRDAVYLKREETSMSKELPEERKKEVIDECRRFDDLLSSAWPVDIRKHATLTTLRQPR